jgi:hypothetical protein
VSSSRASAITTKTSPHIPEGSRNGYTTPRDLTGPATWYGLAHPEALRVVMVAAEALLGATGKDLVLCEHLRSDRERAV